MNQRFIRLLFALLIGLGLVIRISAITPFAKQLSYGLVIIGIIGTIAALVYARAKKE